MGRPGTEHVASHAKPQCTHHCTSREIEICTDLIHPVAALLLQAACNSMRVSYGCPLHQSGDTALSLTGSPRCMCTSRVLYPVRSKNTGPHNGGGQRACADSLAVAREHGGSYRDSSGYERPVARTRFAVSHGGGGRYVPVQCRLSIHDRRKSITIQLGPSHVRAARWPTGRHRCQAY